FTVETKKKQIGETTRPRTIEVIGAAKPEAGVIATRPATAPEAAPSIDGFLWTTCSITAQLTAAAPVASMVLRKATAATPVASRFEPALKPNQPTHSSEAPIMVMVSECGGVASLPKPM